MKYLLFALLLVGCASEPTTSVDRYLKKQCKSREECQKVCAANNQKLVYSALIEQNASLACGCEVNLFVIPLGK